MTFVGIDLSILGKLIQSFLLQYFFVAAGVIKKYMLNNFAYQHNHFQFYTLKTNSVGHGYKFFSNKFGKKMINSWIFAER